MEVILNKLLLLLRSALKFLFLDLPLFVYDHTLHPAVVCTIELTKMSFVFILYGLHRLCLLNVHMDNINVYFLFYKH